MSEFYQVYANIFPAQYKRVVVYSHILRLSAPAIPAPSLFAYGNFFTVKRSFKTNIAAQIYNAYLRSHIARSSPLDGQLDLFQGA